MMKMNKHDKSEAIMAKDVAVRRKPSSYPEPFFSRTKGREKRSLGKCFGLNSLGVNLTELAPGSETSILHKHTKSEEFIYVLEGTPTLETEHGEQLLCPGMCIGFSPNGVAHHLVNKSKSPAVILEIGDNPAGDEGIYPNDDLLAVVEAGKWVFKHKDGSRY